MRISINKKFIMVILFIVLFNLVCLNLSKAVLAASTSQANGKIEVTTASGEKDSEIEVKIRATADISTKSEMFLLKFDKTKLEFVSSENISLAGALVEGNNRDGASNMADGYSVVIAAGSDVVIKQGDVLATIKFKILQIGTFNLQLIEELSGTNTELANGTVTGIPKIVHATAVSLDKSNFTLNKTNNKAMKLNAILTPADSTDTIVWSSSNENVATVDDSGNVMAKGGGRAIITATVNGSTRDAVFANAEVIVEVPLTGISLNETTKTIGVGQKLNLNVSPNPVDTYPAPTENFETDVTWETSNAEVATVTNGEVEGKKAGSVTITAKITIGGTEYQKTATVNVQEIALQSIAIDRSDFTLYVGDMVTLNVIKNPENATIDVSNAKWSSSDIDIVSVENGVVKGLKVGTSTIMVTVGEGANMKEASIVITVAKRNSSGGSSSSGSGSNDNGSSDSGNDLNNGDKIDIDKSDEVNKGENNKQDDNKSDKELKNNSGVHQMGDMDINVYIALMIVSAFLIVLILIKKFKNGK